MALSSPYVGVCSSTDISILWEEGVIWKLMLLCLQCSRLAVDLILWILFTPACMKTAKSHMVSVNWQVIKQVLSLGQGKGGGRAGLAEPWLKFPEFEVVGFTILSRVLLEICVIGATCLCQPKPGAVGTTEWTQHRSNMPSALPWLPQPYQCWSCQKVFVLRKVLKFPCWLKATRRPQRNDNKTVYASQPINAGKGKMINCHQIQNRGPYVISNEENGIIKAFRNIPGITLPNISILNVLKLTPAGHVGPSCIWIESAFCKSDTLYGTNVRLHPSGVTTTFPCKRCLRP